MRGPQTNLRRLQTATQGFVRTPAPLTPHCGLAQALFSNDGDNLAKGRPIEYQANPLPDRLHYRVYESGAAHPHLVIPVSLLQLDGLFEPSSYPRGKSIRKSQ